MISGPFLLFGESIPFHWNPLESIHRLHAPVEAMCDSSGVKEKTRETVMTGAACRAASFWRVWRLAALAVGLAFAYAFVAARWAAWLTEIGTNLPLAPYSVCEECGEVLK